MLGGLIRKVAVARFSRTLATMLSSGVPILDALEIVARTAGNVVVEREILSTKSSIAEGKTIAEPLQTECRHFLECISTGQEPLTGGREGLAVIRALEALSTSMRQAGREVQVEAG